MKLAGSWSGGLLLCLALTGMAGEVVESFPLHIKEVGGFARRDGRLVPLKGMLDLRGVADGPIMVEVEDAHEQVGGKLGEDAADGTRYVANYRLLRFHYVGGGERGVRAWARLRQEGKDNALQVMGYQWTSVRSYQQRQLDPKAENKRNAGKWRWEQIRGLDLAKGNGSFQCMYSWPGSPDLDRLVFMVGDASPAELEAKAATVKVAEPQLVSGPFALTAAVRLVSASLPGVAADAVVIEAEVGRSGNWVLADELALPDGSFRLRARFPQGVPGDRPVAGHFEVRVAVAEDGFLSLANEHARIDFDVGRHGVFRIAGPALGTTFAVPDQAIPLFVFKGEGDKTPGSTLEESREVRGALKRRGEPWPAEDIILTPADGVLVKAERTTVDGLPAVVLEYRLLDGKITATVTVALVDGPESRWQLTIKNDSEYDILSYQFPNLAGLKVGDSGLDDRWANTNIYGPWMGGFNPEDRPYPGWGALGWVSLFDERAGISLSVRDGLDGETSFKLRTEAREVAETCRLDTVKRHCVAPGETRVWTYGMLLHPGPWHAAAEHYGAWFRREHGEADHFPDWVRDSNGWLNINMALRDGTYKWPMLLDSFEEARRVGLNWLQGWGQFGSSSCASFWWPSPKYGPIEEFAAMNREIVARGGHIGYYLMFDRENRYNLIDQATYEGYLPRDRYPEGVPVMSEEMFLRSHLVGDPAGRITAWPQNEQQWQEFRDNLAKLHDEKKYTTWANNDDGTFPGTSMARMNPMDREWQDWLVMWTNRLYVGQWNCDTAYQDVLGCGTKGRSFDLRRGDGGHVFGRGNMDIARRLTEEGKRLNPEFALSAEGKMELVTRWAVGMTSSKHYGWIYIDTHRLTHPDHLLVLGGSNGGYHQMLYNCGLAFIYGVKHDLILTGEVERIRDLVTFRQPFIRYQTRAVYRDTIGLRTVGDGIQARRFDRLHGDCRTILVCAVNRAATDRGAVEVDVSALGDAPFGAFWLASDGSVAQAELRRRGQRVRAAIPVADASALFLVAEPAPGEELVAMVRPELTPGGLRSRYAVANLSPRPRQVTMALTIPSGEQPEVKLDLPPFGVMSEVGEWSDPDVANGGGDVVIALDGREAARRYLHALAEDVSFERVGIAVDDAPDGQRILRMGPATGWQGRGIKLSLRAGCKYRIGIMARRTGAQGKMHGLVRMRSAARGWQHLTLAFPQDRFDEWLRLEGEVVTPDDMVDSDIYLYNIESQETVDYDALRVEFLAEPGKQ